MYQWYKTWYFRLFGKRRSLTFSDSWVWYDRVFRFNGGGYLYGADPYHEIHIGFFQFRTYGFPKQK